MHRALHILSITMITAGVVVLVDVGITLAWKEPLSALYASIQQNEAEDELERLEGEFLSAADLRAAATAQGAGARLRLLADRYSELVRAGTGIGRISIPAIGLDAVVVEGTDTATLRKGPGRYPETAFPGQGKTIGIAGHRTTYLAPFRRIDEISRGDRISLVMPYAGFTYEVQRHEIVAPTELQIVEDAGYERLVLTACHPLYSAAQRWVVFARLVEVSPAMAPGSRRFPR